MLRLALRPLAFLALAATAFAQSSLVFTPPAGVTPKNKHVVLLSGDEEYRSEEALPMLAKILSQRHGFKCTVLFALDPDGTINPDNQKSLADSQALDSADAIIMALRFRNWADDAMQRFEAAYLRGVPIIALRTSTHPFNFPAGSKWSKYSWNNKAAPWPGGFGKHVIGETWVSHWGKHKIEATLTVTEPAAKNDPLLRGVGEIFGNSDVYEAYPPADAKILMRGLVLKGMNRTDAAADYAKPRASDKQTQPVNSPAMPVVWTRTFTNESGKQNKILTTTLGAATDLEDENLRRLVVNGVFWATGLAIPAKADVRVVDPYQPTMYGFKSFRYGLTPADYALGKTPGPGKPRPPEPPKKSAATPSASGGTASVPFVARTEAGPPTPNSHLPSLTLSLNPGDRIALIGNTLAERIQHHNHWETLLHQRFPQHQLVVRNLSWPADEVVLRPRAQGFGTPEEHLTFNKADVILAFFGFNESFAGPAGLDKFKADLDAWLEATLKANYSGKGSPRVALISPIAHENLRSPHLPDGSANNRNLQLYTAAMREIAAKHRVVFADVFTPTLALFAQPHATPFTINGVHLSPEGDAAFAPILDRALFGPNPNPSPLNSELRHAIADKNFHWYHRYRIANSYYVYGGRSGLKFADGPQTNRDVLERERETLDVRVANRDARIWQIARDGSVSTLIDDSNVPPFLPVQTYFGINKRTDAGANSGQTSKTAEGDSAEILPSAETAKRFKLAPGYAINLFASEERFPELANAVRMAFDARGRLWVITMPTYPQWRPGDAMQDKIVILTDTDDDGQADESKVFADTLHLPLGLEFANGGVLVSEQRELVFYKDTNGDDRADHREIILSGFDSADSHHVINQFTFDPGGALYFQEGTFHHTQVETPYGPVRNLNAGTYRFEPLTHKLDVFVTYNYANPHGITFDRWGQSFISDASGGANYFATAFSGYLPYPEKHASMKQWFPKRVRPTAGCEFVSSRHFPDEAQGRFLLNNTIGVQGVLQHNVRAAGSGYEGEEIEPLLLSDDRNFRPVDMEFGPEGALYIVDWQDALIGHMQYSIRDPLRDKLHARIWRITYPSRPFVPRAEIAGAPIASLLDLLKVPEQRTRIRAKQELTLRPAQEVLAALEKWHAALDRTHPDFAHHELETLWVHQWLNVVNLPLLQAQLRSSDHRARAAATRVLCYWRDRVPNALDLLHMQARDEHPLVRLEAVRAASFFKGIKAVEVALEILNRETDYYLNYTLEETMRALDPAPEDIKDPRGLAFVLARLNNDELAQAAPSEAVFVAQIERKGFSAEGRETALRELAKLRGTTREREIVAALKREDECFKDTGAAEELGRLLAGSPREALASARDAILEMSRKDHSLPAARRAGLAGRVALEGAVEPAWKATEDSTDSRAMLIDAIALIGDPELRAGFQPKLAALFAQPRGEVAENVRLAALRALPLMGEAHAAANFSTLAAGLKSDNERATAARALLQLPRSAWNQAEAGPAAETILAHAQTVPAAQRTEKDFVELVQLGTELAGRLPAAEASRITRALRELGVSVFYVKAIREQMRYDVTQLVVEAGKPFEIVFENPDVMPHNLVIVTPGAREEIGLAATSMPMTPDRQGRLYVPASPKVLAATKMLEPGQTERLKVRAPKEPGNYEYVCTFPGHWVIMWGTLVVTNDVASVPAAPATAAAPSTHSAGHGH